MTNEMKKKNKSLPKQELNRIVGQYLKKIREEAGISQSQMAGFLGFNSGQYCSNIERGVGPATIEMLNTYLRETKTKKSALLDVLIEAERKYYNKVLSK